MFVRALQTVVWGGMDAVDSVKNGIDNLPHKVKARAERYARYMKEEFDEKNEELENQKSRSHDLACELGELKFECAEKIIPNALNVIERFQKINRKSTQVTEDKLETINTIKLPYLRHHFSDYSSTIFKGVSSGVTTAGSLYAIAGVYGTASTGTAISALSGAAATNATIAWFGGGSVAAGGAGMAGGMMALGGVVALPVAVFAYMKYKENTEKEITALREYANEVEIQVENVTAMLDISVAMNQHILLYKDTLQKLMDSLNDTIEKLAVTDEVNIEIAKSICLIRAIKDILKVSLFSSVESENNKPDAECLSAIGISHSVVNHFESSDDEIREVIKKQYSVSEISNFDPEKAHEMSDVEYLWLSELHEQFNTWYQEYILHKSQLKSLAVNKIANRIIVNNRKKKKIKWLSFIFLILTGVGAYHYTSNDKSHIASDEPNLETADESAGYSAQWLEEYLNTFLTEDDVQYGYKYYVDQEDEVTFRITFNALCGSDGCEYMFAKITEDGGLCYVDATNYEEAYSATTCLSDFFE